MRTAKKTVPTLDLFRLAAVLLVVMNHTSPLADVSAMADFWLTRVLARVAVPFFLMTTGYFLSRNHWAGVGRQLKKLCLLYGVCILLYLPVNLYAGSFTGPADVLRKLLVDGTFYHLWYFPATILGIVIARWLSRLGLRVTLPVAALLYLIVWPRVNRPEPWTRGRTPTSAARGRISFFWRPSTRWPSSSHALTIFFWNL